LAGLTIALLAGGCVTPDFKPVSSIPGGKALIYIYRKPNFAGCLAKFGIFENHTYVAMLANGTYTPYFATPGTNTFGATSMGENRINGVPLPRTDKDNLLSLNVEAGHTYYVQFTIAGWGPKILLVKDEVGEKGIKSCKPAKFQPGGDVNLIVVPIPI